MSRGFVKEPDELPEPILRNESRERVITRSGLFALRARLAACADTSERKALETLVAHAVVLAPPHDRSEVAFGADVAVLDEGGGERRYTLVGEDEIDVLAGRIGVESPLAVALLGAHPGDVVTWHRPSGDLPLTVHSVEYDD